MQRATASISEEMRNFVHRLPRRTETFVIIVDVTVLGYSALHIVWCRVDMVRHCSWRWAQEVELFSTSIAISWCVGVHPGYFEEGQQSYLSFGSMRSAYAEASEGCANEVAHCCWRRWLGCLWKRDHLESFLRCDREVVKAKTL